LDERAKGMKRKMKNWVAWYMVSVMVLIGITPRVYAGFSPSEVLNLSQYDRKADLQKIQKVLESKMIHERLKELGFTEEGIQNKLTQLTDEQIHQMAAKLDELRIGADGAEAVIIVLLVAVVVLLIVYLMGYRLVLTKS
jgi:hypothetical protein